ncbi:exonuclease domain-containing protein, partial [uncultured Lactobacillus sp.]|uniref:exonuclease domain-containing protein n=1 Tax=uncultured Lactobacillus sp. TaxID=153152 RepID=UPI002612B6A4
MKQAFDDDVFAVVDLETTGTQRQQNDRIIQFGCAIIRKRRVVKTYSFLINPHKEIPLSVENLTGIKNEDVINANDFKYYAKKIRKLLDGKIFVAHNVNFDLPFLNYELVNAGLEPLTGRAIDTVELAQIAFPTYPSYKLRDLTSRLKIQHLNPHQADSDALVTAKLLLKIIKKLEKLPTATLNTLTSLSKGLLRDTYYIFSEISQFARASKRPLAKNLIQVRNLILKKQVLAFGHEEAEEKTFPESDAAKKKLFKGHLRFRRGQVSLINRLNEFLTKEDKQNLIVEAPNGSGKTFSYLMAYAYQLYSGRKLVIATPTKVLQNQILQQEVPQLVAITGLDLDAQEVKSSKHYLDLDGFFNSLYQANSDITTLVWQMGILVWLTETETGDLDELQLTNYKAPFFAQITHPGDARVGTVFSDYDFWNLARSRQEQADILITNHAYLANHYTDSIWGANPYLVVDEAHRFADNVAASRNDSLQFESFWGMCSHLRNILYYADNSANERFGNDQEFAPLMDKLEGQITDLIHAINQVQKRLYNRKNLAVSREEKGQARIDLAFQGKDLFDNVSQYKHDLSIMQSKIELVRQNTNQILFLLYHQQENMLTSDDVLIKDLQEEIDHLDYFSEQTYLLIDQLGDRDKLNEKGFILQITNYSDPLSTNIAWMTLDPSLQLKELYRYFSKKLFVSATLMNNNSFNYMENELAVDKDQTAVYKARASYDVEKHLRILALNDRNFVQDPNDESYGYAIGRFLIRNLKKQNHILVLFT